MANADVCLAVLSGALVHVFGFRLGEWDLLLPTILFVYATLLAALEGLPVYGPRLVAEHLHGYTALSLFGLFAAHLAGLASSILLYRLFFHRLRRFPGPVLARVSNLYPTYLSTQLHLYQEVEKLHAQYGDYVRLGPTELSIADPRAVQQIYSARSPCTKGPFYNVLHPRTPLNMMRDRKEHGVRRKAWDRAFNAKALKDYEPRVSQYTKQLLAHIAESAGRPINAADWFNFYSFDVMGDLAFGKSFNMLRDGVKHYFMKSLHADMTTIGYLSHITWIFPLVKIIPGVNTEHLQFWKWCHAQVLERTRAKPDNPDVFSWILDEFQKGPQTKQKALDLDGEAYLIAVAGSDTTAVTLTSLFFELATHPREAALLRAEVDAFFASTEALDHTSVAKLPYLNAVIDEALRLHPPVPSGLQRVTPPEGLTIGDTFVPGNTIVQVPLYTIQRDERSFARPLEFIPERWTSQPELVKDSSVYAPFSIGLYSCVGKQLGLMELRYVVSQLVHLYDIRLAPGQTVEGFWATNRDAFTLSIPKLDLVFTPVAA